MPGPHGPSSWTQSKKVVRYSSSGSSLRMANRPPATAAITRTKMIVRRIGEIVCAAGASFSPDLEDRLLRVRCQEFLLLIGRQLGDLDRLLQGRQGLLGQRADL